jgi:hypothetical protein
MKIGIRLSIILVLSISWGCSFFGEKNKVEDYIEKPDYSLRSVEYVPVLPAFGSQITPVSLYFGYDQLLYAVDSGSAILSFDAAGKQLGKFNLPGVTFVIQNRSLDLYAIGRMDTIIKSLTYNLPVIYKISQKGSGGEGVTQQISLNDAILTKKLIYPFCINETSKLNEPEALRLTNFHAIGFMDNNSYYVSSSGPQETKVFITRRNSVLTFNQKDQFQGGFTEGDPIKSISPIGLTTLVQPPQRLRMEARKDFIYTSITEDLGISVRYMEVLLTPEGLVTNFKPLSFPSKSEADGALYETFRFKKPVAVHYGGTSQKYIFVADAGSDSIFVFQENGYEGAIPPAQNTNRKLINVSFGGTGSGPTQFIRPSAIAFFDQILYVADAGNKRIMRYKLTSDYEQ